MSATLLPVLDGATEAALRDSIKRFGIYVPILRDQHGEVVDGRHRMRIATELGRSCPEQRVTLPDDPDERAAALTSINDDRRQRMSEKERRDLASQLKKSGHSNVAIASALGVSEPTIRRDLGESSMSSCDDIDDPQRVTRKNGRSYPAKKTTPEQVEERRTKAKEMREQGLSHQAIADALGVSQSVISNDLASLGVRDQRAAPRINTETGHGQARAQKAHERLMNVANTIAGHSDNLSNFHFEAALAVATPDDVRFWIQTFRDASKTFQKIARDLNTMEEDS